MCLRILKKNSNKERKGWREGGGLGGIALLLSLYCEIHEMYSCSVNTVIFRKRLGEDSQGCCRGAENTRDGEGDICDPLMPCPAPPETA